MTTISPTRPKEPPSSAAESLPDASARTIPRKLSRPASPCADHRIPEAQMGCVGASPRDRQAIVEAQRSDAVAQLNGSQVQPDTHNQRAAVELLYCAAFLDDVEKLRIATENRLRSLAAEGLDVVLYAQQAQALEQLEHQATLSLRRAVRVHPLGPWIKRTIGVGEKQGARLIAAIGDVAYNHAHDRPRRGPAELWAYCGFVPGQRRRKGVRSNWNPQAKMRAFLIAESCVKQRTSPYRVDYDKARASWADRDTSDGHKHAHALRVVAKTVLRDLFLEARASSSVAPPRRAA